MSADHLLRIFIGMIPVVAFLVALIFLDSYKLVKLRSILVTLLIGVFAALICLIINVIFMRFLALGSAPYSRYVAPIIEETAKAIYIVHLMRSKKVGFMVDAGIQGFAVGAGFAITENIYTLTALSSSNLFVWIVRGFGTAIMHGGTATLFAIISKSLSERSDSHGVKPLMAGLSVAVVFHSLYNHFLVSPVISAIILVGGLPLIMFLVYAHSERSLQKWLGVGFDTDTELLTIITTGNITQTHIGEYLLSLKSHFSGETVADMLCLLRIHLELSIRAKGILLMREAGFKISPDPEIEKKFDELHYLRKSVGRTGYIAIMPFLRWSSRDLWQLNMLGKT